MYCQSDTVGEDDWTVDILWERGTQLVKYNSMLAVIVITRNLCECDVNYTGDQSTLRVLNDNAAPHIFAWSQAEAVASQNKRRSAAKRKAAEHQQQTEADEACLNAANEVITDQPVDVPCNTRLDVSPVPTVVSHATQTVKRNMQLLSAKLFATKPMTMHYYTGLET